MKSQHDKLIKIGRALNMIHSKRFVNIRGYVEEVTVSHKNTKTGEWVVKTSFGKIEEVPEHLFYHSTNSGLLMRGEERFLNAYANHPIEIEKLPSL